MTPEFVRVVAALDLTLMVSPLVVGATALWRRRPWGIVLGTVVLLSGALYNVVLAAGTVLQIRAGLAGGVPLLALWTALALGCAAAARAMARRLPRAEPPRLVASTWHERNGLPPPRCRT